MATLEELEAEVMRLRSDVTMLQEQRHGLEAQVGAVAGAVNIVYERLVTFEQQTGERFDKVDRSIAVLDEKFSGLLAQILERLPQQGQ